jgi:hypothetical protein
VVDALATTALETAPDFKRHINVVIPRESGNLYRQEPNRQWLTADLLDREVARHQKR